MGNTGRRRLRQFLRIIWAAAGVLFLAALFYGMQATGVPEAYLHSGASVRVESRDGFRAFHPAANARRAAMVFYPGAMVDPVAYVPLAHQLAELGYPVWIASLPFRLAPLESQREQLFARTLRLIESNTSLGWVLAGHSRGGALAADFARRHDNLLAHLVLIATTHPRDFDLSRSSLHVTKIYGTRDRIAPHERMLRNAHLLPPQTRWIAIQGGNHAQFGWYRFQLGDASADISRALQQQQLLNALAEILDTAAGNT